MAHGLGMSGWHAREPAEEGRGLASSCRTEMAFASRRRNDHQHRGRRAPMRSGSCRCCSSGRRRQARPSPWSAGDFTFRELLERLLAVLGRRRLLLPLPFPLEALAASLERLPHPPLTREEVRLLRTNKVAGGLPTPAALGLAVWRLEEGLPASIHAGCAGQSGGPGESTPKPPILGLVSSTRAPENDHGGREGSSGGRRVARRLATNRQQHPQPTPWCTRPASSASCSVIVGSASHPHPIRIQSQPRLCTP
jgi:hypothetical protein